MIGSLEDLGRNGGRPIRLEKTLGRRGCAPAERGGKAGASRWCLFRLWVGVMAMACAAPAGSSAWAGQPVAKVVRQYALTSANDFPQRDPQDWRLLGSNDGGKTWTTLDARKGEVFPERHQRRVFRLENQRAFNVYRLQIDRVRDPAAASSVQLAELEPLGEGEEDVEPGPALTDVVTAQGDNPPLETGGHAFDGRVETKWLDHALQNPGTRSSWIQWQYREQASLVLTNVKQVLGLRSRAGKGYPVRLEGVVAGRLAREKLVCFLDGTGHLEIPEAEEGPELSPGQRVVLEGRTQWSNHEVSIRQSRWQRAGPAAAGEPKRIGLEEPLGPNEDWGWVEAEGRIQFATFRENNLAFELEENERTVEVRVLHMKAGEQPRLPQGPVRVRGICAGLLNTKGERVPGTLWAPGLEAIAAATPALPEVSTNVPGNSAPPAVAGGAGPVLTSIEQIRRLGPEELVRGPRVKVRGVVTELFGTCIQEGAAGVEVWFTGQEPQAIPAFSTRVEIEGRGDWALGHGPIVRAEKVQSLGKGKLPRPERCSWSQLAGGRMVDQWVEVEGVVRSTDGSHLLVSCEGGQLMATIRSAAAPLVRGLVDATVRIRGVSVAATDSRGRVQGIQLLVPALEFVEVEQRPVDPFTLPTRQIGSLLQVRGPKEFIHRVKIEGLLTFQEGRNYFLQDASGAAMAIAQEEVVLDSPAAGWNWLFWQRPKSNAAPSGKPELSVGDQLQVVGFPEMRGYSPVLTEVLVRKVGHASTVVPIQATLEDITQGSLDATLVTLEAEFLRQDMLGAHLVFELQSGQKVFQAVMPAKGKAARSIAPGSRLQVTGVCQVEATPYPQLGKGVASFKLLVGSPADLVILEQPSWWTLKRALMVTGALLVVLALAVGWIGILRRQVEERTRQLQEEIAEHEKTEARLARETSRVQAEIEERKRIEAEVEKSHRQLLKASRLAGMAEVATSVLHNVGNVLNSANVLAALLVEQVQKSKVASVGRLAALLAEHRANLGRFVTEDQRGQELPGYLERLATHLQQEQSRMLEKTKSLTESIQHIKEIVAMQQNYAKVSGVRETVTLTEIVEDALRMHEAALARHQVRLVREYEAAPPVTIDRHKLLQILFNLLENAKYACESSGRSEKQVTVRIRRNGEQRVQVSVVDNGIGIPAENLPRIFGQEFSTRKGGHGFGLHSSILAAQDMGGSLTAQSDGVGEGATFTLELSITEAAGGAEGR